MELMRGEEWAGWVYKQDLIRAFSCSLDLIFTNINRLTCG